MLSTVLREGKCQLLCELSEKKSQQLLIVIDVIISIRIIY